MSKLNQKELQTNGVFKQGDPHPTAEGIVFQGIRNLTTGYQRWMKLSRYEQLPSIRHEQYYRNLDKSRQGRSDSAKRRYRANPKKALKAVRTWQKNNPDKVRAGRRNQYYRDLQHPSRVITRALRRGMNNGLRYYKNPSKIKSDTFANLLGCSLQFFIEYMEAKFLPNMTWNNRGLHGWHIDHIIPCTAFDLTRPEQQKICFHYTNLQPLWAIDNLTKGANLNHEHQRKESTQLQTMGCKEP